MLKHIVGLVLVLVFAVCAGAQVPQGIAYQAVPHSSTGAVLSNAPITVRFSIRELAFGGPVRYRETHNITTTASGLFSVNIGMGTPVAGTFSNINWSSGSFFLQVELDPMGGSTFIDIGTQQMMSVPYALLAGGVKLRVSNAGDTLFSGNGNYIIVPGISVANCIFQTDTLPTRDDNMAMGNPSNATTNAADSNNYLIIRHQYTLSYNNQKGIANWVSWHLSNAWKGAATRCNCFTQETLLPAGYYRATTTNYTGTGFDRGHLCPSDDRDGSDTDNAATFKMTNIAPQAPVLNQQTWEDLERYCRTLITEGNELYIMSGSYGIGGAGSLGGSTSSIATGRIAVSAFFWKVIVVLPQGSNDVCRVNATTRIIAVAMPNVQTVSAYPWGYYRTSVDAIESATGFNLLSQVPTPVQAILEATVDAGATY